MDGEKDKSVIIERSEIQQDQVKKPESIENESKNKSGFGLTIVLTVVGGLFAIIRDTFLDYKENDPRHTIFLRIMLICLFIALEIFSTNDFLGFRDSIKIIKKDCRQFWASIGRLIIVCMLILAFLPSPRMKESITRIIGMVRSTQTPTPTATEESSNQTETTETDISTMVVLATTAPGPTITTEPTSSDTPPPTPTDTPEPTPTSTLYPYKIGVFAQNPTTCTKKDENDKITFTLDRSEEIKDGLFLLGFNATIVPYDQTDFSEFDVLYMPYGWSCTVDDYEIDSIRNFINQHGTGLFIGDPRPARGKTITLGRLFDFDIYYSDLTDEEISQQGHSDFRHKSLRDLFGDIFPSNLSANFPIAETEIRIENVQPKYYYYILKQASYYRFSFIASSQDTPRFVMMPGSEYPVSDYAISKEILKKIILWLAHAPIN